MNNRVIPALLCAAVLAFACGPHPHGTAQGVTTAAAPLRGGGSAARNAPMIVSSLDARVADRVTFTLDVTNRGSKLVELTFPSGQTHEFSVVDSSGREVWRWSHDRMFTQSLQNRQLAAAETATYAAEMPLGELHGDFTVVASLRSATHPVEERRSFTLP